MTHEYTSNQSSAGVQVLIDPEIASWVASVYHTYQGLSGGELTHTAVMKFYADHKAKLDIEANQITARLVGEEIHMREEGAKKRARDMGESPIRCAKSYRRV